MAIIKQYWLVVRSSIVRHCRVHTQKFYELVQVVNNPVGPVESWPNQQ